MGFKLIAGRNFNHDLASDSASVILNESAVKALGLEDPIGAQINTSYKVIGVVSDFHWESLRTEIAPLIIQYRADQMPDLPYSQLAVKFNNSPAALLKTAEARWKQVVADEPFTYHYVDENFGVLLEKEKVLAKAIGFFAGLAIIISCLGLFGLSAYTAEARTKEIGIRKVMGASPANIILLLSKQFTTLVAVSILISIPTVAYISNAWLETFAYRATIPAWIYIAGALMGWMISSLTVLSHTLKATRNNPVDTLKYE
jgi:putative ABC transport system permease protein